MWIKLEKSTRNILINLNTKEPKISSLFLADSFEKGNRGKVDVAGIFNQFSIWGLPASRKFSIIISISGLQKGKYTIPLSLILPSGGKKEISRLDLEVSQKTPGIIEGHTVNVALTEQGSHKILATIEETGEKHYSILEVTTKAWPKLPSGKNLERALKDPNTIKAARAVFKCSKCNNEYIFQINLDPNKELDHDALHFPKDGEFKCRKCGEIHHLKDIEGQVLSQLANSASKTI